MQNIPPHRTLMLLHRLIDRALDPLLAPMGLEHATEGYVTVPRADLDGLVTAHGDPQAVLAGFGARAQASGVMIAEPSLSSAILARIWRSDRNAGAPLTQVEGEILRQFLARVIGAWSAAWAAEGVQLLPEFTMAGALSMLQPQLAQSRWHIARTVVREAGAQAPLGVLLFCYPEALLPQLTNEARSTMWRSRIERGLVDAEEARLRDRLAGPLRNVTITAPVRIRQHMTLGMLNALERGDVVALDEGPSGEISFDILGREVTGHLAASGAQLAIALTSPGEDEYATEGGGGWPDEHHEHHDPYEQPPDPQHYEELAI